MDISENEKVAFFLRVRGIEPITSEFWLRAKSSNERGGIRTRDLAQIGDERNHQTKRLTSAFRGAHARVSIKLPEHFFSWVETGV